MSDCFACSSPLEVQSRATGLCTNPQCPGGRSFYLCGHCRQLSFSTSRSACLNSNCATFGLKRDQCPDCKLISLVDKGPYRFCLNRRCPSNDKHLEQCPTCHNQSLLPLRDGNALCLKSDCPDLLTPRNRPGAATRLGAGEHQIVIETPADQAAAGRSPVAAAAPMASEQTMDGPAMTGAADAVPVSPAPAPTKSDEADPWAVDEWAVSDPGGQTVVVDPAQALDDPEATAIEATEVVHLDEDTRSLADRSTSVTPPEGRLPVVPGPPSANPPPTPPRPPPLLDPAGLHGHAVTAVGTPPVASAEAESASGPVVDSNPVAEEAAIEPAPGEGVGRPPGNLSEIELAYEFVRQTFIENEEEAISPLILVFGLAGCGKSTYLTMLGDMLVNGAAKYHFPYPDVTVRSIHVDQLVDERWGDTIRDGDREILTRRIRDLTFDFAAHHYQEYLMNGAWVPTTGRETGDGGGGIAHSYFLVAEILHKGETFGRIITMETSGEDYLEILQKLSSLQEHQEPESPLHRILLRLINAATGMIVLLDPESMDNDLHYHQLYRVFKEETEGRAAHALARLVDERLQKELSLAQAGEEAVDVQTALAREQLAEEEQERFKQHWLDFGSTLQLLADDLEAMERSHRGVAELLRKHRSLLDELETLLRAILPAFVDNAQRQFSQHGRTVANFLRYYEGMVAAFREEQVFKKAVHQRLAMVEQRDRRTQEMIDRVLLDRSITETFHEALLRRWEGQATATTMQRLRFLALVVTKSDRHPIVYPPSDYPTFKLPTCKIHMDTLAAQLALLGGHLRCYNATATGYSVQRGARFFPGPGNSFTPVNIVEPLFDMLVAEAEIEGLG